MVLQEELSGQKEEVARLQEELRTKSDGEEVKKLKSDLQKEKEKSKQHWRMTCQQAAEQEEFLAEKDREIEELKRRLAGSRAPFTPPSHSDSDEGSPSVPPGETPTLMLLEPPRRRGKAPPVDQYTGGDPNIRFDNWLPALQRAARWNGWTDEEMLIQLAGHLRGKALQEWNVLVEAGKATFEKAVVALR